MQPVPAVLPQRPLMPPLEEARMQHQATRLQILEEDHEEVVQAWMREHISETRLANWGPPDLSSNPLADICRQLSTPGLYGARPRPRHVDERSEVLIGEHALLDQAGYWTKMQTVQYRVHGMGDYIVSLEAVEGQLAVGFVHPHNVWVVPSPMDPTYPLVYRELYLVQQPLTGSWEYVWLTFDRRDPRAPQRRIERCEAPGETADATALYAPAWVGETYPYLAEDGEPLIPRVIYRDADAGRAWNHLEKRGAARGTLSSVLNWTSAGNCAIDASGQMVMVGGLRPMLQHAQTTPTPGTNGPAILSIEVTPGMIAYHEGVDGQAPTIKEIGPGQNLEVVAQYAASYEQRQLVRWGLGKAEQRMTANPWSGAALYISAQEKRDHARRIQPLFRRGDLEALRLAAVLLRPWLPGIPERGYSILYQEIARSPEEERADREAQEWEVEQGLASRVDLYMRRNPGADRELALKELARIRADELAIETIAKATSHTPGAPTP